ncbi:hypothetical protein AQUCO_00800253v1 [Aquilegia coerulea]|uniref:Uncharacterized protein n=1 Tax=Aquilegia coerulea TaxID=218851 RepID=A0A2G5EHY1_AQUCA|nr:hypothetical protein AQUCO_00800253v1 [Aquilegia coerulea]
MICDSLEKVWVHGNCSELKKLPQFKGEDQSIQLPASLKEINGSREWWDSLEWDPAYSQNILQPFFIELQGMYGLIYHSKCVQIFFCFLFIVVYFD